MKPLTGTMVVSGIALPYDDNSTSKVYYNMRELDGANAVNQGNLSFFVERGDIKDLPRVGSVVNFSLILEEVEHATD